MKTIIVIPAYNEEKTIGGVIREVRPYADEIVAVDDGSADATSAIAAAEGALVCRHLVNRGQGASLQTGIERALGRGADIIVTFDADGQHCPEEIPALISPVLNEKADVALGTRFMKSKIPFSRRFFLKGAVIFTRLTSGLKVSDTHNGLRAFSRRAAEKMEIRQDGYAHASEILNEISRLKLSYAEVPITLKYTAYSLDKGQKFGSYPKILADLFLGRFMK